MLWPPTDRVPSTRPQMIKVKNNSPVRAIAGSMAHTVREHGYVIVQGIGKAVEPLILRASVTARSMLLERNALQVYTVIEMPEVVTDAINEPGVKKTVIRYTIMTLEYIKRNQAVLPKPDQ